MDLSTGTYSNSQYGRGSYQYNGRDQYNGQSGVRNFHRHPRPSAGASSAGSISWTSGDYDTYRSKHRKPLDDDEEEEWSTMTRCGFSISLVTTFVLLWGAFGLILYWAIGIKDGFAWNEDPTLQFNLHPFLMVTGLITFMGHALLTYRACRCCKRVFNKVIHTFFHLCATACAAVGVIAVFGYHDYSSPPIKNLYSLHSWLGLITLGLFSIQFVVGFFSFLVLLICDSRTASFRASLVPLHSTFGLITFMLAIATALTGITEQLVFSLGGNYQNILDINSPYSKEGLILNTLGVTLAALAIMIPFMIRHTGFTTRVGEGDLIDERL